jgi:hypothetical protein
MKKLLAIAILTLLSVQALAQHRGSHDHHGGYRYHRGGPNPWVWVAPAIIGGAIGYELYRSQQPVIVQQPPVYIQNPPVYIQNPPIPQQNCSPWTEMQNPDGTITRTRTCSQ